MAVETQRVGARTRSSRLLPPGSPVSGSDVEVTLLPSPPAPARYNHAVYHPI